MQGVLMSKSHVVGAQQAGLLHGYFLLFDLMEHDRSGVQGEHLIA